MAAGLAMLLLPMQRHRKQQQTISHSGMQPGARPPPAISMHSRSFKVQARSLTPVTWFAVTSCMYASIVDSVGRLLQPLLLLMLNSAGCAVHIVLTFDWKVDMPLL